MAILKKISRVSKIGLESYSHGILSGEDYAAQSISDEEDEIDSGAASDSFGSVGVGDDGMGEFVQWRDSKVFVPFELYELPDLTDILSVDTWNDCLTEDERFALTEFLPDMEHNTYNYTLKQLLTGENLHFNSPLKVFHDQLKGGFFEPQVQMYRNELNLLQKKGYDHFLVKYQNSMVSNFLRIKEVWAPYMGHGIEERLRLLNIRKSQKVLMQEKDEEIHAVHSGTDLLNARESSERFLPDVGKKKKSKSKTPYVNQPIVESNLLLMEVKQPTEVSSRRISEQFINPGKYGKPNPKGILKVSQKTSSSKELSEYNTGYDSTLLAPELCPSTLALERTDQSSGYGYASSRKAKNRIRQDVLQEHEYERPGQTYQNATSSSFRFMQPGKKMDSSKKQGVKYSLSDFPNTEWQEEPKSREGDSEILRPVLAKTGSMKLHNKKSKARATEGARIEVAPPQIDASHGGYMRDTGKRVKYSEKQKRRMGEEQVYPINNRFQETGEAVGHGDWDYVRKGDRLDYTGGSVPTRQSIHANDHKRVNDDRFALDSSMNLSELGVKKGKKLKVRDEQQAVRKGASNMNSKSSDHYAFHIEEPVPRNSSQYFGSDTRAKASWGAKTKNYEENGTYYVDEPNDSTESENTQSSSSRDGTGTATRKLSYSGGGGASNQFVQAISVNDHPKMYKSVGKGKKGSTGVHAGNLAPLDMDIDLMESPHKPLNVYCSKRKPKEKLDRKLLNGSGDSTYYQDHLPAVLKEDKRSGQTKRSAQSVKNGSVRSNLDDVTPVFIVPPTGKSRRRRADMSYPGDAANSYQQAYDVGDFQGDGSAQMLPTNRVLKKCQEEQAHALDHGYNGTQEIPIQEGPPKKKKKKGKPDLQNSDVKGQQVNSNDHALTGQDPEDPIGSTIVPKKSVKKKTDAKSAKIVTKTPDCNGPVKTVANKPSETKAPKKLNLIKPSVLTGFSFSIIHLLSAVRAALVNADRGLKQREDKKEKAEGSIPSDADQKTLPSLPFQEIVEYVRMRPGDPAILTTQEPLQDLVRGVLKIFSAKTAPLGAKGWKPLALYGKPTKGWSWVGPVPNGSVLNGAENTSPVHWDIPQKMLVKLVDSYATWLKNGQETLKQIGSLPPPPMMMQPNLDEKERFRDLRAQKSLTTIKPSADEVREYFRKEEYLRYTVPDRAFAYTALDGCKSVVAPLRRCGGKPTSKARDHFMLKPDRPPHVTILCLVRDAAARLPGSIGTRADVCTLIRDSQYIVEDVSDAQVNQVVSGALDRLHYERDPCVQFDGERKLWVYLHREREDEDFEDDGTSSTKKWKRQKKDGLENPEVEPAGGNGDQETGDQIADICASGYEFANEFNIEPSPVYSGGRSEFVYNDRIDLDVNNVPFFEISGSAQGTMSEGHTYDWET